MDVMGKMVELLEPHMSCLACEYESGSCELTSCRSCNARNIADHLISNGVTVQEWVSVEDRLPEVVSIHKGYRSTIKKSIRVLCVCVQKSGKTMVKEGYCEWYNDYPEPRWQIPGTIDKVTHWQYLPQPPKVV